MIFQEFTANDLDHLPALQPDGWGDLRPRFSYFLGSEFCKPMKIEENGQMVAVGTTMFHTDTVWLACIVTHPEHRNKGLGRRLTEGLIDSVDRTRYPTISLDATEFGYPVYNKLGFEVEGLYAHLKREKTLPAEPASSAIVPFEERYRSAIYALDRVVSGEDRKGIMSEFLSDASIYLDPDGSVQGAYIPSWSDGPVIATRDAVGFALMNLRVTSNDTCILPLGNHAGIKFLQDNGFQMYKTSRRMHHGPWTPWRPDMLYNRISGSLG